MKLTLFPNPCSESKINVRIADNLQNTADSERATLVVSDIVGRVRMTTSFRNELDVTALRNGLYFLELRDQSGTRLGFAKFIISR